MLHENRITLNRVRVRFSDGITTASVPPNTNGKPAHSAKFIIEPQHPQLDAVKKLIMAAATATFKARAQVVMQQAQAAKKVCLALGDGFVNKDGEVYNGFAGNLILSARNPAKPIILTAAKQQVATATEAGIYDGCYVNVQVDIFGYTKGSNGVSARLLVVQFAGDGEPLGGGGPGSVEDFGEVEQSAQASAEFGGEPVDLFGVN
jgi:hypothetical protein